jgi:hypothetical protein
MHSTIWSRLLTPALAVPAALALAACSGDPTGTTGQASLSQADASAAADVVVGDLSDQADGATTTSSGAAFSMVAAPAASAGAWYATACSPPPIITTTGSTTTFVFTNCAISRLVPVETLTRNGEVDLTLGAGSRVLVFKAFSKTWERVSFRTGQVITTSATLDGTRSISGDGTTLQHHVYGSGDPATTSFQTSFVHEDASTSKHERNWQSTFVADQANSIQLNLPLPAGVWSITGNSTWTRNPGTARQKVWTFSTAASAVHYDPACTAAPQFDSGTLTVQAVNAQSGGTATFTITFNGCGTYAVAITKNATT